MPTYTKGNIIVEKIKIGDIQWEFSYGHGIKSKVKTLPTRNDDGYWTWENETESGQIINYGVHEKYSHYSPNLYDYEAYVNPQKLKQ